MDNNSFGDLAVTGLSGPSEVMLEETVPITISLTNIGTEPVFGVILSLPGFPRADRDSFPACDEIAWCL